MVASRSWASDALRGLSSKRSLLAKFRILSMASVFAVALLFIGHSHLPFLSQMKDKLLPGGRPPYKPGNPPTAGALKVWDPPDMESLVHGVNASEGVNRKPTYDLIPFPPSPMDNPPPDDGRQRPWLGAVICSAWDIERRMLIRFSWMKLYKDVPMDQRFVVSNPGRWWTPILQQENRTFGDLIILDHLSEDDFTANTVKTIEFYRWLVDESPRKYAYVSKMDTDLFLNARGMWNRYLRPRLTPRVPGSSELVASVNHTIVGQFYYDEYHKSVFPHGAIYTASWDLVELLPKLQNEHHIIAGEDITVAWLLLKARQKVTLAVLSESEKFEFDHGDTRPGEKTPWARKDTDLTSSWHALYGDEVIAVHQLKSADDWLLVAEVFDEKGVMAMPAFPDKTPSGDGDKPGYGRPYYYSIPDDYWEIDYDGTWLCQGTWKLEPGVDRDMKKRVD